MKKGFWKTVGAILNRPMFGTQVIPPDARADPALLPEEDFPLNCPKCDYLLRGLPEQRCPECGEAFDRGRLLVIRYVRQYDSHGWDATAVGGAVKRLRIWAQILAFTGCGASALIVKFAGASPINPMSPTPSTSLAVSLLWLVPLITMGAMMLFLLFAGCELAGVLVCVRRNRHKRRRVIAAIIRADTNAEGGAQKDAEV